MSNLNGNFEPVETILIVDDNPVNLGVVVAHLEQHGYEVLVALGGAEALKRAEYVIPDLILLDVMMPDMDGLETCRRLKANSATEHIPIVFMTALDDVRDKVAAFEAGGVDYVSKPFQVEELLARIRTHLALRAAQRRLKLQNEALEQEIIARCKVESALRESEQSFRRLFETSGDGILLVDAHGGRVRDANARFLQMTGQSRESVLDRPSDELPWLSTVVAQSLSDLASRGSVQIDDCTLEVADGPVCVDIVASISEIAGHKLAQFNFRDITDRKKSEARIRYLALHDPLTGLANRSMFYDRLSNEIARARRNNGVVALLAIDLDHFKHVNDSLGHLIGDKLLEAVAGRLRGCLRECDIPARLGGDEFAVALTDLENPRRAGDVADRILTVLKRPFELDGQLAHISGSIGISLFPDDGDAPRALMQAADTAMYGAKKEGRNGYRRYASDLDVPGERWRTLSADVYGACARGEFELYYQPQVRHEDEEIIGFECLLRWHHPTEGLISPVVFVPLLEERGLMVEVGAWILQQACRQNAAWQQAGFAPARVAVNLSAQQFYRDDIVHTVRDALDAARLDPCWLELELTESLTLDDTEATLRIMQELKALGVALSLDDFGTGWSSLSYLRRFPLDRIKIDRTFIRDMEGHEGTAAIIQSILALARTLGMDCIAEGVETEEQRAGLASRDCLNMQGFLFSEPLPATEIVKMLERRHDRARTKRGC